MDSFDMNTDRSNVLRLEAEGARLREGLAASHAVIEQMREALELHGTHAPNCSMRKSHTEDCDCGLCEALALPANLDALHEARAEALDRADRIFMQMSLELRDATLRFAYGAARDVLKNEAAAHRARKEGK